MKRVNVKSKGALDGGIVIDMVGEYPKHPPYLRFETQEGQYLGSTCDKRTLKALKSRIDYMLNGKK